MGAEKGGYLDWDGEVRWASTNRVIQEVFPDDYSEGREMRLGDSGVTILLPGRVQADEKLAGHKPTIHLLTENEVSWAAQSVGVSSRAFDWTSTLPASEVRKTPGSDAQGHVGFACVKPCLRLWVPQRAYARKQHVTEVLLGVRVEGTLHNPGAQSS